MQNISYLIPLTSQLNSVRHVLINNSIDEYIFSNLFYAYFIFDIVSFYMFKNFQDYNKLS